MTVKNKADLMRKIIAHFEDPRIVNLHVFSVFETPMNSTFEKKTTLIALASLLLISVEIFVYEHQGKRS